MRSNSERNLKLDGRELLSWLAASGRTVFTMADALEHWPGRRGTLWDLLARLADRGWVERLSRGRYLIIPVEAGLSKQYTLPAMVLATQVVSHSAVSFWSALSYHGLTEQIPDAVYVETSKAHVPNVRDYGGTRIRIVRLPPFRIFGQTTAWFGEQSAPVTDLEKTLVDGLFLPALCGGMAEVVKGFVEARERINWDRMTEYAQRMKRGAIFKRLGVIGERLGMGRDHLDAWRRHAMTAGPTYFDPAGPKRGQAVRGWRIVLNMPLQEFVR
jgi:predicted transcriptional regulator of viral defense system